jgi:hypothetical protein
LRHFRNGLERTVEDFYRWAYGDIFTNIIRATIAEYLVACALDLDRGRRSSWDGYDFLIEGIRLEVKSSACFVSGKCPTKSNTFDIEPRSGSWHADGTPISVDGSARRCAHLYIFAHHWSTDRKPPIPLTSRSGTFTSCQHRGSTSTSAVKKGFSREDRETPFTYTIRPSQSSDSPVGEKFSGIAELSSLANIVRI